MDVFQITSDFAILDVKKGRKKLAKYFADGGKPIPVMIAATIDYASGGDDGISIEFALNVHALAKVIE